MGMGIDNVEDIIESTGVIKRIESLTSERDGYEVDVTGALEKVREAAAAREAAEKGSKAAEEARYRLSEAAAALHDATEALADWASGEEYELKALEDLVNEVGDRGGWEEGARLIRSTYWEDYVKQHAYDTGAMKGEEWPCNHINWRAAADELEHGYVRVDFGGVEYLMKA